MSDHTIQRALASLRMGLAGGTESAARKAMTTERADALAARAHAELEKRLRRFPQPPAEQRSEFASSLIESGRGALRDIAAGRVDQSLSPNRIAGLEAIVRLTARPSIPIHEGVVGDVPEEWSELMQLANSALIEQTIAGVGRVTVPEFGDRSCLGTAFMASNDLALTNAHVAAVFAEPESGSWKVGTGLSPRVDFIAEAGREGRQEHKVVGIVAMYADPRIDVAVLRLERTSLGAGSGLPAHLVLNSDRALVVPGRRVFVVGYPAAGDGNDPIAVDDIFGEVLEVKRFAPGEIIGTRLEGLELMHDCSTLRGSSGSCVVDFASYNVLGLHHSGDFKVENRAVSFSRLAQDGILAGTGIDLSP